MKTLADKAYNLSLKCDMQEQADLILAEEQKLAKLWSEIVLLPVHAQTAAASSVKFMDNLMISESFLTTT